MAGRTDPGRRPVIICNRITGRETILRLRRRDFEDIVDTTTETLRDNLVDWAAGWAADELTAEDVISEWAIRCHDSETLRTTAADRRFRLWMLEELFAVLLCHWPDVAYTLRLPPRLSPRVRKARRDAALKRLWRHAERLERQATEAERLGNYDEAHGLTIDADDARRTLARETRRVGRPKKLDADLLEALDGTLHYVRQAERYRLLRGLMQDFLDRKIDVYHRLDQAHKRGTYRRPDGAYLLPRP